MGAPMTGAPTAPPTELDPPWADRADDDEELVDDADAPGRRARTQRIETLVGLAVAIVAAAWVIGQLHPNLLVTDTTPAGGDMGAHVWAPAWLRDSLLHNGRLTGWTPDWYAGFPAYHFYMVVPALLIVALDVVLPYAIAFKLVTVLGVATIPVSAWAMGRLARLPFPAPPLLAVATLPFLFDKSFSIYGGNIASTLAGEFSFSIALSLTLVYFGVLARGLRTGEHRALAAVLLALVGLCHLIPAFFALAGTAVLLLVHLDRHRLRYVASMGVVAGALGAFWALPFFWRRGYMTDMGWEKLPHENCVQNCKSIANYLLRNRTFDDLNARMTSTVSFKWVLVLALAGAVISLLQRRRFGAFLVATGLLFAAAFVVVPQGRLWNARLLPFWYLCLYLLAAVAIAETGRALATLVHRSGPPDRRVLVATPVVGLLAVIVVIGLDLGRLPFGDHGADGRYRWLGLTASDGHFVRSWAKWNYEGYERKPAWPEFHGILATMDQVGQREGCGRAMWEYEAQHDRYGTPMALMLLPFFTDGCIGSMEGLYFESSATTPYHFLTAGEVSQRPSNPQRDLPYRPFDLDAGVAHMQLLGVRYYMAIDDVSKEAARAHPDLTLVAESTPWEVYRVADSQLVEPVRFLPAVVEGQASQGRAWQDFAVEFFIRDPSDQEVLLAADGPSDWQRIAPDDRAPVPVETEAVSVGNVEEGDDVISFDVDRVGTPVLVKASYFPNWRAEGADGPYRVAPNLMVVIPTDEHVELRYGLTAVDLLAWGLTFLGLAGLVVLAALGRVRFPPPSPRALWAADGDPEPGQADDRADGAAGDGGAGRASLLHPNGDLHDLEPGPLGLDDELGVEEVGSEPGPLDQR